MRGDGTEVSIAMCGCRGASLEHVCAPGNEFPVPGDEWQGEAMGEGGVNGVGAAEAEGGGDVGSEFAKSGVEIDEDESGISLDFSDGFLSE